MYNKYLVIKTKIKLRTRHNARGKDNTALINSVQWYIFQTSALSEIFDLGLQ